MSWGGSVLAMVQSLRGNARRRPSLKRGYPRLSERTATSDININYRKIRALSDAERAALRKRIAIERKLKTKKSILALFVSIAVLVLSVWGLIEIYPIMEAFFTYQ